MTRLRRAPGTATLDVDGTVYAASLPGGPIIVLEGIAALIWDEACAGDRETIVERVAAATDAPTDEIRAHVDAFVADLVARGLLE
ncbi:PqqD family protein [Agromyces sp. SYSU K20354]|uniref:PqqD family protein n=1 Tax=Agromyces cavernae TaxID=2898659 RepID=UPI001E507F5C|nr:PqqD family protein [Agromyces cavernae]MCD2441010.1 PqqD family protein [Agromyces cavernae]